MGLHNIKNGKFDHSRQTDEPASFEEAITATEFGKYNYILLFVISLPCISQLLCVVDMSFVVPVAECQLELTLEDKGLLNAIMFAGMIISGCFWGYLCDALGRKNIIVYGYLITGFFCILAALSTHKIVLLIGKLTAGFFITGPFSATTSHIAEFHSSAYRGRVNLARGIFLSIGNLLVPVLAWAILPRPWIFSIFGLYNIYSWNIFLLVCCSTTVFSGLIYLFIPESPKFLMTAGKYNEALIVMQTIYAINTGKPKDTFPIKNLKQEEVKLDNLKQNKLKSALKNGFLEMGKIMNRPYIYFIALACFNAFSLVMSSNTMKLWLPQIFQSINDYQFKHNGSSNSICVMLEEMKPEQNTSIECTVNLDNFSVYLNTFISAVTRIIIFGISEIFIKILGVKSLTIVTGFLSAGLSSAIYFANNSETVTILASISTGLASVTENLLITLTLELFPTTLRTIALCIHLTGGRIGTLVGNIIFPYLLYLGCSPPFIFIGIFGAACGLFSFLYSSVENKPLE